VATQQWLKEGVAGEGGVFFCIWWLVLLGVRVFYRFFL